jgi:hypothetical protein
MVVLAGLGIWLALPAWNGEPEPPRLSVNANGKSGERQLERRREWAVLPVERIAPRGTADPPLEVDDDLLLAAGSRPSLGALPSNLVIAIRDFLDAPLAGVRVTLRPGTHDQRAGVTGDNGEVAFDDLAGGRYAYRVQAPGYPLLRAAAALELAAGEMRRLELQVADHDRDILGRVLDQHGAPVAGLEVSARLYRPARAATLLIPRSQAEQRDETGVDGSFEISGLQDGEYELRTLADGFHESAKAIVRAGADAVLMTVAKRTELHVFGQVASATGELLAGASVTRFGSPGGRTRTDEEGRYELLVAGGDEAGHDPITFRADGYRTKRLNIGTVEPNESAELRLDATLEPIGQTVTVEAHLIDERGEPVAGERAYLYSPSLRAHYQAVSGVDGLLAFTAVAAGPDYDLRISPRGPYKAYTKMALDLSADTSGLEIVLETLALGRLSGRMVDTTGAAVAGFSLRLTSADAPARWRLVHSDARGYFEVDEVPEGALVLQTASTPRLRIDGVRVDADSDAYVEPVLDWGTAGLDGWVVDANGQAVAGARVDLHWHHERGGVTSRAVRSTITDGTGGFLFSRLGLGGMRWLEVRADGHEAIQRTLDREQSRVEVRLRSIAEAGLQPLEPSGAGIKRP